MEKTKLFTTSDGKDIYDGDRYYAFAITEHCYKNHKGTLLTSHAFVILGPILIPEQHKRSEQLMYFVDYNNAEVYCNKAKPVHDLFMKEHKSLLEQVKQDIINANDYIAYKLAEERYTELQMQLYKETTEK